MTKGGKGPDNSFLDTVELLLNGDEQTIWEAYRHRIETLGCDTLLYAYVDTLNYTLEEAPFAFKSTVPDAWYEHYYKEDFHMLDHVLVLRKRGIETPLYLGSNVKPPEEFHDKSTLNMMAESGDAGFKSSVNFLLEDPIKRSPDDIFAVTLGSSGSLKKLDEVFTHNGREINLLTQLMHSQFSHHIARSTFAALTARERECLAWVATGYHVDRISDKIGISNATVNFHLKNANSKLSAKTLPEAVALAVRLKLFEF